MQIDTALRDRFVAFGHQLTAAGAVGTQVAEAGRRVRCRSRRGGRICIFSSTIHPPRWSSNSAMPLVLKTSFCTCVTRAHYLLTCKMKSKGSLFVDGVKMVKRFYKIENPQAWHPKLNKRQFCLLPRESRREGCTEQVWGDQVSAEAWGKRGVKRSKHVCLHRAGEKLQETGR